MEQTEAPNLYKHAARAGGIYGAAMIALTVLLYIVSVEMLVDWKLLIIIIAISFGFNIYYGIDYRNSVGGYLSYGQAFIHGVVLLAVCGVVASIFSIILYNVIDTDLPARLTKISLEKTEEMLAGFGMPQDKLDEALAKAEEDAPKRFTTLGIITQFGWNFIFYAIVSVITAIFVKRNPPEATL
jgi:hypothetical protein